MESLNEIKNLIQEIELEIDKTRLKSIHFSQKMKELKSLVMRLKDSLLAVGFSSREIAYIMVPTLKKAFPEKYGFTN